LLPELVAFLEVKKLLSSNDAILKLWIDIIRKRVKEELIYSVASVDNLSQEEITFAVPAKDVKINAAASYWISEVFMHIEVCKENIDEVMQWLKTKQLLSYIDCINREEKGRGSIHVHMVDAENNIEAVLVDIECKKESRPLLLYVDTDYLSFGVEDVQYLGTREDCIVVVHDKEDRVGNLGFSVLDKKLHLYMHDFKKGAK